MSGRKQDAIWHHFKKIPSNTMTGCRAKCNNCGHELQGLVKRMKIHYNKCSGKEDEGGASTSTPAHGDTTGYNERNGHLLSITTELCRNKTNHAIHHSIYHMHAYNFHGIKI